MKRTAKQAGTREEARRAAALGAMRTRARALGISDDEFAELSSQLGFPPGYERGRDIVMPGDRPGWLHVVGRGAVRTIVTLPNGRRFTVQIAKEGHIVGLTPIERGRGPGRFGAVAHERATIVQVGRELAEDILARLPREVWLLVAAYHARALSRMLLDVCRLYRRRVPEQILLRLVRLARDHPLEGRPGAIALRLRQHDIAELVGADRGTVNRALRKLVRDGLLGIDAGRIVLAPAVCLPEAHPGDPPPPERHVLDDDAICRRELGSVLALARRQWGLPSEAGRLLLEGARLRRYLAGEPVHVADAVQATILVSGAVRVECDIGTADPLAVWMARPGHLIGAGWVGPRGAHEQSFRAVAYEESIVAVLSPDLMFDVLRTVTAAEFMHFLAYCHRGVCRQLYDRSVVLNLETPEALLYQLKVLATDFPESHAEGTAVALDLTGGRRVAPRLLAAFLGRAVSSLSRAFWTLCRGGHLAFVGEGNRILVRGFGVKRLAG